MLTYVRHGDVAQVHSLRRGAAEALEIVAHGDKKTSRVVGRRICDVPTIDGSFIAAVVRDLDQSEGVGFLDWTAGNLHPARRHDAGFLAQMSLKSG